MEFVIFIIIILIIVLFVKLHAVNRRLDYLEKRIAVTAEPAGKEKLKEPPPIKPAGAADKIRKAPEPAEKKPETSIPEKTRKAAAARPATPEPMKEAAEKPPAARKGNEKWEKIEKQFVENWTGILGTIAMVTGVAFFSIYAALSLSPFFRFLMVLAFAALLYAIHFFLKSKPAWDKLSRWIRSASGVILLFGCLGSGGIPGLQWIYEPVPALLLLVLGIAINLYFGYAGGTQYFASLHVVLSLVALAVAPQSQVTLIIASVTTLLGTAITYRARWEYHLLFTLTSFLIYHLFWYFSMDLDILEPMPVTLRITGIASTAIIGITAAFVHYREIYRTGKFDAVPFTAHLVNWFYMAAGLLLYSTGSKWNTLILGAAAAAAFLLSRRGKALGITWLFVTDTLIAQSLALFCLYTLERWGFDSLFVSAAMFVEILIFFVMMIREDEKLLKRAASWMHGLAGLGVIIVVVYLVGTDADAERTRCAWVLGMVLLLEIIFHAFAVKQRTEESGMMLDSISLAASGKQTVMASTSGIIAGVQAVTLYGITYDYQWAGYLAAFIAVFVFILRQKIQSNGLGIGAVLILCCGHIIAWLHIAGAKESPASELLVYALPVFAISAASLKTSYIKIKDAHLKWPGIYLFTAHLIITVYYISNPVSQFISGIFWLVLSVIYLECSVSLAKKYKAEKAKFGNPHRHMLHAGYMMIMMFVIRHVMVHMQSELYAGFIRIRLLIEIFAICVFLYWALAKRDDSVAEERAWKYWHPLFWELIIIFMIFIIALEFPSNWLPVAWILFALLLLYAGDRFGRTMQLSRLRFYALMLYWTASFHIAFISSSSVTPSEKFLDQGWLTGCAALLIQFGYVIYFYRRGNLKEIEFPPAIKAFTNMIEKINRRPNLWVYYPFIIAIALFFYWSFDSSILTLLWTGEAFGIFVLSVILRENHFRYLSMAGVAGCLVRLVFYDLSQTGTLTRAVVFFGVGIMMLVMNSLYNKYRDRFGL